MATEFQKPKTSMGESIASKTITQVQKDHAEAEKLSAQHQATNNIGNSIQAEVELVSKQVIEDAKSGDGKDVQQEVNAVQKAVADAQHKVSEKQKADAAKDAAKAEHAKA